MKCLFNSKWSPIGCIIGICFTQLAVAAPGDLKWAAYTGEILFGAPAIGPSGEVVIGSEVPDTLAGHLHSFNADGSLRWIFDDAGDWIDSSPAIAEDGTVYAGSWDNFLYAINGETGALKWSFETGALIIGSPAIGPDGSIYVGSNDGFLYAVRPDGSQRWVSSSSDAYSAISASPVLNEAGTVVYIGDAAGQFHAFETATGSALWTFDAPAAASGIQPNDPAIFSPAAIGQDGTLYFGSENGVLYALDSSGSLHWTYEAAGSIRSSVAIAPDGTIVFAAQDGYLYGIDAEGFQLWETFVGDVFYCTPAIDASGNTIIGAYAGSITSGAASRFLSVNSAGTVLWEYLIAGYNDSSPNIAPDGHIYIGSHEGYLYKLEGSAALNPEGWPRFMGNRRQTGYIPDLQHLDLLDYFPEITVAADGWAYVDWFGSGWISNGGLPWLLHIDHGYIYLGDPVPHATWFYDAGQGDWLFSTESAPNYYYGYNAGGWLFHLEGTDTDMGRWFYDFASGSWITDPL